MGWLHVLAATYDNCISQVGKPETVSKGKSDKAFDQTVVLLPLSHLTNNAGIEIIINADGVFQSAAKVDKNDQLTVMPVTEDSASRGNNIAPMPLFDKLSYVAGDYDAFVKEHKQKRPYYEAYMKALHAWADLPDTPLKVKAICQYLDRGCVIKDLKAQNVFDGKDVFVRFMVTGTGLEARAWCDEEVRESYIRYFNTLMQEEDIDYVTGEFCKTTSKLPAKIRSSGDRAKLISSNDTRNYTFRGRFSSADEAVTIGYEVSQKAHNTLRWLIARQGYRNGSESIVCWSPENLSVPSPMNGSDQLQMEEEEEELGFDTEEQFAKKLNKALAGYQQNFTRELVRIHQDTLKVVIMAVDTASGAEQGRLAVTYYNEQEPQVFLNHLLKWYSECCWRFYVKDKGKALIGSPSPEEMVLAAFGTGRGDSVKAGEKVKKKSIDRLLPCIVQGRRIPKDIVQAAVRNVSHPERFSENNWKRLLSTTCAMIKKYQHDDGKEVFSVALNKESRDRDYLFGRLLAVAHQLEDYVNFKSDNSGRETNAMRYWCTYTQKPAVTCDTIRKRLQPYITKLTVGSRNYYESLAEEIFDKLEETGGFHNQPLKENYLLGYYSQIAALRKQSKTETTKEENE